jgi:hypothetical protein
LPVTADAEPGRTVRAATHAATSNSSFFISPP